MLPLLVRITNTQNGESEHSAFASSPVRIGRNQLNELVLNEPFVSQWHAVVRFDEHKVRYVDLGSTNGTTMGGRRLARHVQVEIDAQSDLRIGPLQLSFARAQVTPDMYAAPRTTIFSMTPQQAAEPGGGQLSSATIAFDPNKVGVTVPGGAPKPAGGGQTMFLAASPLADLQTAATADTSPAAAPPGGVDVQKLTALVQAVKPAHDAYRQAWANVLAILQQHIAHMEPYSRDAVVLALGQQFPQLPREPEFRDAMHRMQVSEGAFGEVDAAEWIKRLGGKDHIPPGQQINTALAMERVGAVLESYSQAFVELRKGYEQFGEEMALQLVQERNPLHDADSGQEVLDYLLDWTTDGTERVRELTRAFADLALHQVALLNGVMEGVRGLLQQLSPQELSGAKSVDLARRGNGGGFLEGLFNFRKASLWRTFVDRHVSLYEEDRFARELFGRKFARAYFMVTGGHLEGAPEESGAQAGPAYGHPQTSPYQQSH